MARVRDTQGRYYRTGGDRLGDASDKANAAGRALEGLTAGAARMGSAFEKAGSAGGEALRSIADKAVHLTARLAEVGVAMGVAFAAHGVAGLNAELEQTQISLGAVFQAGGYYKNFESGFARATEEVTKMKREVMALPGTFGELAEIMTTIASPAAQTGASIDQIRGLAEKTMLTAAILKVPQDVAAREMAQLLSGRAGAHNILGTRMGLVGESARKFNEEDPSQRLKDIEGLFAKYAGAADRFAQSFKANSTTMKDNLLAFEQVATKPLFDKINHALAEANTWLDAHRDKVKEIADQVGNRLAVWWDKLEATFKRIEPTVERIAAHIGAMSDKEIGEHLKHAGEAALALKLAPGALSLGAKVIGGLGGGGAAALGPAALGLGVFGAAGIGLAAAGGHAAMDTTSVFHEQARVNWDKAKQEWSHGLDEASQGFVKSWDAVKPAWEGLVNLVGAGVVDSIHGATIALEAMGEGFNMFGNWLDNMKFRLGHGLNLFGTDDPKLKDDVVGGIRDQTESLTTLADQFAGMRSEERQAEREAKQKPKPSAVQNFQVKIEVRGSEDPSRVARLVQHHLERIARNPTRSPHLPDYSSPTR